MNVDTDTRPAEQGHGTGAVVIRWLRRLMVTAVLVGAGYQVVRQWAQVSHALGSLPPHRRLCACARSAR